MSGILFIKFCLKDNHHFALSNSMLLYDCISTGANIGFIEVIQNSCTIFKVQTDGGTISQFQGDNDQLFKWIYENNPNEKYLLFFSNNYSRQTCLPFKWTLY